MLNLLSAAALTPGVAASGDASRCVHGVDTTIPVANHPSAVHARCAFVRFAKTLKDHACDNPMWHH